MQGKQYPLRAFEPFPITRGRHTIAGRSPKARYQYHNEKDSINEELPEERKILIDEIRGGRPAPLFRVEDLDEIFKRTSYDAYQDGGLEANIRGFIAEKNGRNTLKNILRSQRYGRIMGLFEHAVADDLLAENDQYRLEADSYPNISIYSKIERRCIAEIDGLFLYRQRGGTRKKPTYQDHMFILESKAGDFSLDAAHILDHILDPLRELKPAYAQTFVLMGQASSFFLNERRRILHRKLVKLHDTLHDAGRSMAFIPFQASPAEFDEMAKHIMTHYLWKNNLPRMLPLKVRNDGKELYIYNGGQSPLLHLVRDPDNPKGWLEEE